MNHALAAALAVLALAAWQGPGAAAQTTAAVSCDHLEADRCVTVGALLDEADPFDMQRLDSMLAAAAAFNSEQLAGGPDSVLVRMEVHGITHGDALAGLEARRASDPVMYYVGPTHSGDLADVLGYAADSGIVLVSPSSSAASLAIPGDSVFRLAPTVRQEAAVVAGVMAGAPVRAAVTAATTGTFGDSILAEMSAALNASGVRAAGTVRYDPDGWEASLPALDAAVAGAGEGAALLLMAGFSADLEAMAAAAAPYGSLNSTRWFVPSGVLDPGSPMRDAGALAVARSVRLTALAVEDAAGGAAARASVDSALAALNKTANAYDYSAHDSVFLLGRAVQAAASAGGAYGPAEVAARIPAAARAYTGALGDISLNAAGDLRAPVSYGVWEVAAGGSWELAASEAAPDTFCAGAGGSCVMVGVLASADPADGPVPDAAVLAADAFNAGQLARGGGGPYLDVSVHHANGSGPAAALAAARAGGGGPSYYVGPSSDAALDAARGYAARNGIVLVSPSSTAAHLAIPGDEVFRLAPSMLLEAPALAAVMAGAGTGAAVAAAPEGPPGDAALAALAAALNASGVGAAGTVRYGPGGWEGALPALDRSMAGAGEGAALLLVAGEDADAGAMAAAAAPYGNLSSARWFAAGGGAHPPPVLGAEAQAAAQSVRLTVLAPAEAPGGAAARAAVGSALAALNATASARAYSAYDSVFVLGGAVREAAAAAGAGRYGPAEVAALVPAAALAHTGALGDISLNAAGDLRAPVSYAIWEAGAGGAWELAAPEAAPEAAPGTFCTGADGPCVKVGVLAPADPAGDRMADAAELAADDFNREQLARGGGGPYLDVSLHRANGSDTAAAMEAARAGGDGPSYFVGAADEAALAYAARNGIVLVSPTPHGQEPAAPGDGAFRLAPPARAAGPALASMLAGGGIATALVVGQDDGPGRLLAANFTRDLAAAGVDARPGAALDPSSPDWAAAASSLDAALAADPPAGPAAVLLAGGPGTALGGAAGAAAAHPRLAELRWFVAGGALDPAADPVEPGSPALEFALRANATALAFAPAGGPAAERVDRLVPGASAREYAAHDSVLVLGGAVRAASAAGAYGPAEVASLVPAAARAHEGALGDVSLDVAGDLRSPAYYGAWNVREDGSWGALPVRARADGAYCAAGGMPCAAIGALANGSARGAMLLAADDFNRAQAGNGSFYVDLRAAGGSAGLPAALEELLAANGSAAPLAYAGPPTDAGLALVAARASSAGLVLVSPHASPEDPAAEAGPGAFRLDTRAHGGERTSAAALLDLAFSRDVRRLVAAAPDSGWGARHMDAVELLAPSRSVDVSVAARFPPGGADWGAAAALLGAAASRASADAAPGQVAVLFVGTAAGLGGMAAAASDYNSLAVVPWLALDTAGYAAGPVPDAAAGLGAGATLVSAYAGGPDGGASAARIASALLLGGGEGAGMREIASHDAVLLLGGALRGSGYPPAPGALAGAVAAAAPLHGGALGPLRAGADGGLRMPPAYGVWEAGDGRWELAGTASGPGTCGIGLRTGAAEFGEVEAGSVSAPFTQTVTNVGTLPVSRVVLGAGDWMAGSGGPAVLPAGATEIGIRSGWADLRDGATVAGGLAAGESLDVLFRLDLRGAVAVTEGRVLQNVTYAAACD